MSADNERAARYSDLFGGSHEHTPDCAYCPFCTGIAMVRDTSPEVLEHLAAAARELVIAAGLFMEDAGQYMGAQPDGAWARDATDNEGEQPSAPKKPSGGPSKVRHIDIG